MDPVTVACVGAGNWGKNQVRTFATLPACRLKYIIDITPATLQKMQLQYPQTVATSEIGQAIEDPEVQAIIIATSAPTHYRLAKAALLAHKDVFIEKPMVLDLIEGMELIELAERNNLLIQVGHLLLFHPAVTSLKLMLDRGDLGTLKYIYTQRLNLGTVRSDENALWSLGPHDISLANYLLASEPVTVTAVGGSYLQKNIEDVVFLHLEYPGQRSVHIHVSWLDPHKTRSVTLVGSRKMAVFDDMQMVEKLRIYDKGLQQDSYETFRESFGLRNGDIVIPSIPNVEPLRLQAEHFLLCVATRQQPLVSGPQGLSVVRTLQHADAILHQSSSHGSRRAA